MFRVRVACGGDKKLGNPDMQVASGSTTSRAVPPPQALSLAVAPIAGKEMSRNLARSSLFDFCVFFLRRSV